MSHMTPFFMEMGELSGVPVATVARVMTALARLCEAELARGRDIKIPGFGRLTASAVAERAGRNPKTGEPVVIAARRRVRLVVGARLKAAANEGKVEE